MIAKSRTRVEARTAVEINRRIYEESRERAARLVESGGDAVRRRLGELDEEWDIERMLEANASSLILATLLLGRYVHRAFYVIPPVVAGFLLQHAVQGWCPPIPALRRLGYRTPREIEEERRILGEKIKGR